MASNEEDHILTTAENSLFLHEMHEKYLRDPSSVSEDWQNLFKELDSENISKEFHGASWFKKPKATIISTTEEKTSTKNNKADLTETNCVLSTENKQTGSNILQDFRRLGFTNAKTNPLTEKSNTCHPLLEAHYASNDDMLQTLDQIYCGSVGAEFCYISNQEEQNWLTDALEEQRFEAKISDDDRKDILQNILQADMFENFLHKKFAGAKRFSVEGGESLIVAIEALIKSGVTAESGEIVLGMAHRGRLNVLTNVMGKSYTAMFSEFGGCSAFPESVNVAGDVKYHLGFSNERQTKNGKIKLSLSANPSHLEAINPVNIGKTKAKQDLANQNINSAICVLVHGDASISGQGIIYETIMASQIDGYTVGGTFHIIVNNQIGFTAEPHENRSGIYAGSEAARAIECPIFHVNGDDPEAVFAATILLEAFRREFNKDVFLDIVCYRRYGHNEGDEPRFTQPSMYKKIDEHARLISLYSDVLINKSVINADEFEHRQQDFMAILENALKESKTYKPESAPWFKNELWKNIKQKTSIGYDQPSITGISEQQIENIMNGLVSIPDSYTLHKTIAKNIQNKKKILEERGGLDWGAAELVAFGSLLQERTPVRITGQDSCRGTFSHRHAVLTCINSNEKYIPLNHISDDQAQFSIHNSYLSEYAVMGFEYGYSLVNPNSLTIWEAQFGDFVNGAQIIIDQFISSAETKWLQCSNLVLLLPHGYEGQGSEHSSARLERFLQSCAEDNMQVLNCTTPANYFHALRRQVHSDHRKPLVVMTPKSLLRHSLAISSFMDISDNTKFQGIIPESDSNIISDKVKTAVLCSGKIYYDLIAARKEKNIEDIAIIRVEQLYPLPLQDIESELKKYTNLEQLVWCQEEPKNMGAYSFILPHLCDISKEISNVSTQNTAEKTDSPPYTKHITVRYVGRKLYSSPCTGYMSVHKKEQEDILNDALSQQ